MTLAEVLGQPTAVGTLERALRSGRVHHAYRFEGPEGVGKELAAFGLAQALLCEAGDPVGCGRCRGCTRVVELAEGKPRLPKHPDVILIERGLYPPELIASDPGRKPQEKQAVSIDQIRTMVLARASYPPVEGRARIVIVRRVEELTPEAANALLKTLEEPRRDHHFVLLTAHPDELLPTIRSRTLPVRFGPLPSDVLRTLLERSSVPADRLEDLVELAGGSVATALELADDERVGARETFTEAMLEAVAARTFDRAVRLTETAGDRGHFAEMLVALAARLARDGRTAARREDPTALRFARMYDAVVQARLRVEENNANPSHVVLHLAQELRALGR